MRTIDALKKKIVEDIGREKPAIAIHDVIKDVLKEKWNGKSLNKRVATHVKEKLTALYGTEPTVYYEVGYSNYVLKVWGLPDLPDYNKKIDFYIGYVGKEIDPDVFEHTDACHGEAAKKRNANREILLNDTETLAKIATAIDTVKAGWEFLMETVGEYGTPANEIEYTAINLTGLKKDY